MVIIVQLCVLYIRAWIMRAAVLYTWYSLLFGAVQASQAGWVRWVSAWGGLASGWVRGVVVGGLWMVELLLLRYVQFFCDVYSSL